MNLKHYTTPAIVAAAAHAALFLLAPDVPAVLLELAFISNKQDEANLQSLSWRRRTMGAAATAIDAYFNELGRAKHASAASSATR